MGTVVLVCAVLAAMAAGVLLAYSVCLGLFALFSTHARVAPTVAKVPAGREPQVAEV